MRTDVLMDCALKYSSPSLAAAPVSAAAAAAAASAAALDASVNMPAIY